MKSLKKKKISIYTLSEELGVSPATVSKALRNNPTISAEVRGKIQQMADDLNFKPRLVSTKPLNICMLVQKFQGHPFGIDGYASLTMEGVAEYCQEEKLEMSIYTGFAEEMNQSDIVRELRRRTANGAIILCATDESSYIQQMNDQRFPYFCIDHQLDHNLERTLVFNNEKMGYLATKHLLSLGHRTIGIIRNSIHLTGSKERYLGYRKAMEEACLEVQDRLFYSGDPVPTSFRCSMQLGVDGIKTLVERVPEMTAVFAVDDTMAYGAMNWLYRNNISIPEQISIIGISDYPSSKFVCPPLTTVNIPYKAIGYEIARQVHRLCRGLDVCVRDEILDDLSPKLIVRESTALVRKSNVEGQ